MSALELHVACGSTSDLVAEWYDRGVAGVKAGNIEEAYRAFRQVLEVEPDNAAAYNGLGICFHFMGNRTEAATAYEQAARLDSRFAKSLQTTMMDRLATLYRHRFLRPGMAAAATPQTDQEDEEDD